MFRFVPRLSLKFLNLLHLLNKSYKQGTYALLTGDTFRPLDWLA
jgi:hypothetical protein